MNPASPKGNDNRDASCDRKGEGDECVRPSEFLATSGEGTQTF